MDYEQKYYKYKQKYLELKKVIEGGGIKITQSNISQLVGNAIMMLKKDFDTLGITCEPGKFNKDYVSSKPEFSSYKFRIINCGPMVYNLIVLRK